MKRQILSTAALSLTLILGMVFASGASAYAVSLPPIYFAAAGQSCDLPDGSSGVVGGDGHTCCPPSTVASDGTADPVRCLYAKYINPTVDLLAALVGIAVVIAIVYGGIEYVTSGGDPQRAAAGRKRIIEALIGLGAFFLLYTFLQFLIPGGFLNG